MSIWDAPVVTNGAARRVNGSGAGGTTTPIEPEAAVFVDDSPANVDVAAGLGFRAIQFHDAAALRRALVRLGLLPDVKARASVSCL